ncbi:MAG TPA: hypothetical protein VGO00_25210 [Kofleriaceae bacterium]|jgi:hypothetical protein|nr:hypothetical protein [Kofleriaceae bacterium]
MWKRVVWLAIAIGCGDQDKPPAVPDAAVTDRCTTSTCDPAHDYCFQFEAGVAPEVGCNAIPAECAAAPSCACIVASISESSCAVSCMDSGPGAIVVTCEGI